MRWVLFILLFCSICCYSQSGYNAYAIHKLTKAQLTDLAANVPQGLDYRFGGEEYTTHNPQLNTDDLLWFMELAGARKIALVAPNSYGGFSELYERLSNTNEVTYGNEQWFDIEKWEYIRKDIFTYIFNRKEYYKRGARNHVNEAKKFRDYMAASGNPVEVIINVPLPQNRNLTAFLEEVARHSWVNKVDIHIYGKPTESNYMVKLARWISKIQGYGWHVMVGEFNGVDLKKHPNLKNSLLHRDKTAEILVFLASKNITEVYFFTLVATDGMMEWQNPPIYHRYRIGNTVTDELYNVFP